MSLIGEHSLRDYGLERKEIYTSRAITLKQRQNEMTQDVERVTSLPVVTNGCWANPRLTT